MSPHTLPLSHIPSTPVKDGFKFKDGLFEYSKSVLKHCERDTALKWVETHLPALDDDLREFMQLSAGNNNRKRSRDG